MELNEVINLIRDEILDRDVFSEYCRRCERDCTNECVENGCLYELAIETVLKSYEELRKENEELKSIDLTTVYLKGVADEKERWRNKVKKFIKENSYTDTYDFKTIEVSKLQELLGE